MAALLRLRRRNKPRVFRRRINPLEEYDDYELRRRYRLSRELIQELYDLIGMELEPKTRRNFAIPAINQICCALRYYATGTFQSVIGDGLGIHRTSVSLIITRVTNALCRLSNRFIKFPISREDQQRTKEEFYALAGMPNVLGAIDGTLINILAPHENENVYVSRKGSHSLNVLAICDANMRYTYAVSKFPGSTNDAFIWSSSNLCAKFEDGTINDGWLIGDSGFGVTPFLLTPFLHPNGAAEQNYNNAQTRSRVVIEKCFGVTKQRFRCLHKSGGSITYSPGKCCKIIIACFILHNMCIQANVQLDDEEDDDSNDDDDDDGDDGRDVQYEDIGAGNDGWQVRQNLVANRFAVRA